MDTSSSVGQKHFKGGDKIEKLVDQWRGERYDSTSTRTGPLQSKKIELKDNAKKIKYFML